MKNFFLLLALGLPTAPTWAQAAPAPAPAPAAPADAPKKEPAKPLQAVATTVTGRVKFRATPKDPWAPLTGGRVLAVGTEVLTGPDGRATLQTGPAATLILKPFSRVTLAALWLDADAKTLRTLIAQQYGRVEFDVRDAGFKNDFKVACPTCVMAVKGTGGELSHFGLTTHLGGVPTNRDHAIAYRDLLKRYRAFLSANQSLGAPDESWLDDTRPGPSLFTVLANQTRGGGQGDANEWWELIRQAGATPRPRAAEPPSPPDNGPPRIPIIPIDGPPSNGPGL